MSFTDTVSPQTKFVSKFSKKKFYLAELNITSKARYSKKKENVHEMMQ